MAQRTGFVPNESLSFGSKLSTLSHSSRILFRGLGSDFWRQQLLHEEHADLAKDVLVDLLFSGLALIGGVVAHRRSIGLGQHFPDHLEGVDDIGLYLSRLSKVSVLCWMSNMASMKDLELCMLPKCEIIFFFR